MKENLSISPVMTNISRIDRDLYFEAVKGRGKNVRTLFFAVTGIILVPAGLLLGTTVLAVSGLFITVLSLFSHLIIGRRDFDRLLRQYPDGKWTKTISFYPDRIETRSGNCEPSVFEYSDIHGEIETEHLFILDFGKKAPATMMRKDGFVNGSYLLLRQFICDMRRHRVEKG